MDDKEYYSLMNRTSSFVINNALKKLKEKQGSEANKSASEQVSTQNQESYKNLETRQGKADAEMLMEKKDN